MGDRRGEFLRTELQFRGSHGGRLAAAFSSDRSPEPRVSRQALGSPWPYSARPGLSGCPGWAEQIDVP